MIINEKFLETYTLRHCHPTYTCDGYDIEANAYQRIDTESWDVFFNDIYNDLRDVYHPYDEEDNKMLIFHYPHANMDYQEIQTLFHTWVETVLFTHAKNRDVYLEKPFD